VAFARRAGGWLARRAGSRIAAVRRARALRRAWRLPRAPVAVRFAPSPEHPLVSVVIPAFDRWRYTNACLRALAAASDPAISMEVIVVDDASTDRTAEMLASCTNVRAVRLERNGGFAAAANAGAAAARGTYLHFLNNDAIVDRGWLRPLLDAFAADARAGAAVSQLRHPDGTLAEAGGVIWRDGRGSNYGRGGRAADWRYRSVREVDYGSAASLMVRRDAFERAGGFTTALAPAYYEDVDLCFALRANGLRTIYQPRSVVHHAEGVSYGSNRRREARELQERARTAFEAKWRDSLRAHFEADPANADRAARRLCGTRTVVVADEHVPFVDRDAGSRRIRFVTGLLRARGWHVLFASLDPDEYEPYASALRESGAELIAGFGAQSPQALARMGLAVDAAWLCRPGPAGLLATAFRRVFNAKVIFDTVDLHYVRLEREERALGKPTGWQAMRERELELARGADLTLVTSGAERELLAAAGIARACVLPVVEPEAFGSAPGWAPRRGVAFLGNYAHAPNVDAAVWLAQAVMPLVWERLPGLPLTLAGADPTRAVRALAGRDVEVTGYVPDPAAALAAARVFAAPLRFGAGVKGKIVYALAHGIPVVTTPVGAEGIFEAADYGPVASTAAELAAEIVRVHEDRAAWEALAQRGRAVAARFTPEAVAAQLDAALAALYAG
jgi:O-antigen biosynthesis protein